MSLNEFLFSEDRRFLKKNRENFKKQSRISTNFYYLHYAISSDVIKIIYMYLINVI